MIFLRQSTASQEFPLGHFVDSTDGDTAETALTIANTDIKIWVTGATTLASKNSGGATHIAGGVYYCVMDATDTATIGPASVFVHVAGALSVRVEACVLDEAVYDALFGTSALATVGGAVASVTGAVGSVTGAVGSVTGAVGSVTGAVGSVTGNVGGSVASVAAGGIIAASFGAGAIDATAIAANAITAAKIADAAIDNATFAADVGSTAIATNVIGIAAEKGVVHALNVTTYAEPGIGTPGATTTLIDKIGFLYKNWRNKKLQTATQWSLLNDDGATTDQKCAVADDGTTASKNEIATG